MKKNRWLNLIILLVFLAGCSSNSSGGIFSVPPTSTPLPSPQVTIIPAPDADAAIRAYLEAFKVNDYASMYAMLTKASQDGITQEDFAKRYTDALNNMSAGSFDYEILSTMLSPYNAQAAYRITYHTALVGDLSRDIVANMDIEGGQWKIRWDDTLIMPELAGGMQLLMNYEVPARGNIYDRAGLPVVTQADAFAFGIIPGQIDQNMSGTLVTELSKLCGIPADDIKDKIAASAADWYLPMCEGTKEEAERLLAINPGGLIVSEYNSRYYFSQGLAPQSVGYTLSISKEELDAYRRLGYRGDEKVGHSGIEKWAEDYLSGKHGGTLYVVNPATGQPVTKLGESAPQPADSIYLTIDKNLQYYAQQALRPFTGAAVVMERETGRVLAIASSPGFDSNIFEPTNVNNELLTDLFNNTDQPLVNRAAQSQYPLGSVFKIITFSAGLESGLFLPETTYDCKYDFTDLQERYGGPVLHDWTYQHCQDRIAAGKECNTSDSNPSGSLTYSEGLMRSCDPYFWHISLDLYENDRGGDISKMARAFGLGSPTGIEAISEAAGNISEPTSEIDATNQAIGQGDVQVTPLQVATFMAAIGNGGTLYRPQIIEKITDVDEKPVFTFKPEARGTLPLRSDNLKLLQEAMKSVVQDPRGTANFRLRGLTISVAGKTGTAETGPGLRPHAWFAGYTMNAQSGLPDIAIAVILESQGEGSDFAAPIFRWLVQTYYYGTPQTPIAWFGPIGGPNFTPTPFGGVPTRTPRP
jgi:penicillin-binding protein 2